MSTRTSAGPFITAMLDKYRDRIEVTPCPSPISTKRQRSANFRHVDAPR